MERLSDLEQLRISVGRLRPKVGVRTFAVFDHRRGWIHGGTPTVPLLRSFIELLSWRGAALPEPSPQGER